MKTKENHLHWSEEKEVISSNKPLKLLFSLINHIPSIIIFLLVFPVSLFYLLFSKRARSESFCYQKQLKNYLNGRRKFKISPYKQILSFSICIIEKIEGWLGKIRYDELIVHNDDLTDLISLLNQKKGAVLISSHLGNMELLRSLSSYNRTGVNREVPVSIIMEWKATAQFTNTLKEINPKSCLNIISPDSIGPDTICILQERIQNGELVVFAADRTSPNAKNRVISEEFLGKKADFPYGVFLLSALLNAPTFFVFALRDKSISLKSKYNMFVERTSVSFECSRTEREKRIHSLCHEFVTKLENYCIKFPYQWYNFYNFWLNQNEGA